MTSDNGVHVGKPPFFDGNNYDYWKVRMTAHLKAMSRKIQRVVNDGYVILDPKNLTPLDEENELLNDQAINVLFSALDVSEFNRVKNLDGELDEFSYDDLVEMLNDADEFMTKEKAKLKDLKLKIPMRS